MFISGGFVGAAIGAHTISIKKEYRLFCSKKVMEPGVLYIPCFGEYLQARAAFDCYKPYKQSFTRSILARLVIIITRMIP